MSSSCTSPRRSSNSILFLQYVISRRRLAKSEVPTLTVKRPGEFRITKEAVEFCNFPEGATILDIGCGEGDSSDFLSKNYKLKVTGIDINPDTIEKAKTQYPELDFKEGDGEFLDGFDSRSYDGVMMECVLSQINLPIEAAHEAYCVLKVGGKLILSGLYHKEPTEETLKEVKETVDAHQEKHKAGLLTDEEKEHSPSKYKANGVLLLDPLRADLYEMGFEELYFQDKTEELVTYGAEILMDKGSLDGFIDEKARNKKTGYFLLILEKKVR
ncbi:MAG: class I SAM-dependent methyltransferase [Spirochaetia bacterium]|nr:class I SAM-dependent methyltransferase [Spirochaetia bacterium]